MRAAVRERAERGVDVVKIMTSGGAMTLAHRRVRAAVHADEIRVVVDEAHGRSSGHRAMRTLLLRWRSPADAGLDCIEHCTFLTAHGFHTPPGLAERIAAAGIVVVPRRWARARLVPAAARGGAHGWHRP